MIVVGRQALHVRASKSPLGSVPRVTADWFERRTHRWQDWSLPELMAAKKTTGQTVSLVVPARM